MEGVPKTNAIHPHSNNSRGHGTVPHVFEVHGVEAFLEVLHDVEPRIARVDGDDERGLRALDALARLLLLVRVGVVMVG